MTHRHHHRGPGRGRGCGPARGPFGMRSFNREEWLARLEEYQRDLEQRTADVADLIKRLRQDPAPETAEA